MSNILHFSAGEAARAEAERIIDALGPAAGLQIGRLARSGCLAPPERTQLLNIEAEIARILGFSWYFEDEPELGGNPTIPNDTTEHERNRAKVSEPASL